MKIKMITLAAGPEGILATGAEVEVPVDLAMALIEGGYAVEMEDIDNKGLKPLVGEVIEEAVIEPQEKAVARKNTKRIGTRKR